eukprot:TRINITY_DN67613_c9_g9_i1.p1 TRINITY_DN67613_c9_g9~~TRINITY_DN67613_c9_g9_i1.p1  ORF type:complete len:266 (+),score=35.67 TRINITY_DN67613_c9_g9_i1:37-834(+)
MYSDGQPEKKRTKPNEEPTTTPMQQSDEVWDNATAMISAFRDKTQHIKDQLKARETAVTLREQKMAKLDAKAATKPDDRVILNVGGVKFETTRGLLTKHKDTFFFNLFRNDTWQPDKNGEYFIDRSPEFMDFILDWYRTGKVLLDIAEMSKPRRNKLLCELDFYQITDLYRGVRMLCLERPAQEVAQEKQKEQLRTVYEMLLPLTRGLQQCSSCKEVHVHAVQQEVHDDGWGGPTCTQHCTSCASAGFKPVFSPGALAKYEGAWK